MTHLRKLMLEELQGRKSLHRCLTRFIDGRFDSTPEEQPDHLPGAQLLGSFGEP